MNVKIRETGEEKKLIITDSSSGVDWSQDLVGNAGALVDGQFVWSEEDNAYLTSQETYEWWDKYFDDFATTEREIAEIAERLGIDAEVIRLRVQYNTGTDYEMHRWEARQVLDEIEQQHQSR